MVFHPRQQQPCPSEGSRWQSQRTCGASSIDNLAFGWRHCLVRLSARIPNPDSPRQKGTTTIRDARWCYRPACLSGPRPNSPALAPQPRRFPLRLCFVPGFMVQFQASSTRTRHHLFITTSIHSFAFHPHAPLLHTYLIPRTYPLICGSTNHSLLHASAFKFAFVP